MVMTKFAKSFATEFITISYFLKYVIIRFVVEIY